MKKLRLRDSQLLADTYQEALQAVEGLQSTETSEEEMLDSVSEVPTSFLIDLLTGFIHLYDKLLEEELAIFSTEKLYKTKYLN